MQPHFTNDLELKPCNDGRNFLLCHSMGFYSQRTGLIVVPRYFKTDLASVPRVFWNLIPPFGKYDDAAVIHDWLYRTHITTRAVADATLMLGMTIKRVNRLERWTIYLAVRIFGRFCWGRKPRHIDPHHPPFINHHD